MLVSFASPSLLSGQEHHETRPPRNWRDWSREARFSQEPVRTSRSGWLAY